MATLDNILDNVNIAFVEKAPESPDEAWGVDASRTRRTYVIDGGADTRFAFARTLLGFATLKAETINEVPAFYISRQTPHSLPYLNRAGVPFLYAQVITRTTPVGTAGPQTGALAGLSRYTKVFVEVEYRTTTYDIKEDKDVHATNGPLFEADFDEGYPDEGAALKAATPNGPGSSPLSASRYVTRVFRPGTRFLTLKSGMMQYVSDNKKIPEGVAIVEPFVDFEYTWHGIPAGAYPAAAVQFALGGVNDTSFDGFTAGTLLFTTVQPLPGRSPFGDRLLDVKYGFKYCPKTNNAGVPMGHNAVYRTFGNMDYVLVQAQVGGRVPYRKVDFSTLFRPDQPVPL